MTADESTPGTATIDAIICFDEKVFRRYRDVLRHLGVGLIDHIGSVRLVTPAVAAESLTLGPIQTVIHEPLRWPFRAARLRRLQEQLATKPPTVIHALGAASFSVAEHLADFFDAALIFQCQGYADVDALVEQFPARAGAIVCASTPIHDALIDQLPSLRQRTRIIRPGVSCAVDPTCFGDDQREPTVLTTADLVPAGGVDTLLHAVNRLQKKDLRFLTFLLGEGPDESALRKLAQQLDLGSSVIFAQPQGDILRAMVGADIFIQPNIEPTISARSLQALSQGMAVISVAGGVHDAYDDGNTALLVAAATVTDLAGALERLLCDHELARRLAANAIAHMRTHHTMSAMAEQAAEVYRELAIQQTTFKLNRATGTPPARGS